MSLVRCTATNYIVINRATPKWPAKDQYIMKTFIAAACAALFAIQPASAATVLGDYNVYASGNAYISGGSYGDIASGSFANANGSGGTNFTSQTTSSSALTGTAQQLSTDYAALASTGTATNAWGAMTLTGTQSGTNVFNITGATWAQLYALTFSGPGTGAIVNVSGSSLTNYVNLNFGSLSTDQVVFNFYDATNIAMGGMNVKGSILAPGASVNISGGSVLGSVISDSFHSEGAMIGGNGYQGFSASANAVPEPATWALMIVGFGMIGAAMRRRQAAFNTAIAAA